MIHTPNSPLILPVHRPMRRRLFRALNIVVQVTVVSSLVFQGGFGLGVPTAHAAAAADIDQCRNGTFASPQTCVDVAGPLGWENGNANSTQAHYLEGDSIPYRIKFTGLSIGSHTVTIEWDTTKSGEHAIDYVTTYNRTEATADPCSGIAGCGSPTTFAIPVDPNVTGAGVTPAAGNFTLYNGTITAASAYTLSGTYAGDSSTQITLTFTAANATPVLAWGGHIATRADWGAGNSAIDIQGSPYHTSIAKLDGGSIGNRDRSLSADAVIFPGSVTIVKQATPEGSQSFGFTSTDLGGFSLVDDGTSANTTLFDEIIDFKTYAVTESAVSGWTLDSIVCVDPTTNSTGSTGTRTATIEMAEGEDITCTFANARQAATVTVIKNVVIENGGTAVPGDFTMHVSGTNVSDPSFPGAEAPGTVVTVDPGSYAVTEDAVYGYTGSFSADCTGTVAAGENKTCTVTNNDIQPKLTVTKVVVNNNGGTAIPGDFPLFVGATGVTSGVQNGFNAAAYVVSETPQSGYTATISGDCDANGNITLNAGDVKSCTITNDDQAASLTIIKHVVNDNGGNNLASGFTMHVTGGSVSPSTFPGNEGGTGVSLDAGSYSVSEDAVSGYTASYSADCTGTLAPGEHKTCTITNDDVAPSITLNKVVVNDNGGTAGADDFGLSIDGTSVDSGDTLVLAANTPYALDEAGLYGYSFVSLTGDAKCPAVLAGTVTLDEGEDVTCTITNDDEAPKLTVTKIVVNNDGGNAADTDFPLFVDQTPVATGVQNDFDAGAYTVSEAAVTGYTQVSIGGDCNPDGSITLNPGDVKECTIVNDDEAPTITLEKVVVNNDGGTAGENDFGLSIGGTPVTSGQTLAVAANTPVALDETGLFGYSFVSLTGDAKCPTGLGGTVTLDEGEDITCTITNDDVAPKLTVVKHVVNDNGGDNVAGDFTMEVLGTNVSDASFPGDESGSLVTLDEGAYSVSETGPSGYADSYSSDCTGTIAVGETKTCTVTNDDQAPTVTLIKSVTNDNGGTAGENDFGLSIGGTGVTSGQTLVVNANTPYALSEVGLSGYQFTGFSGDALCPQALGGTVILEEGEDVTCTVTNNDVQPTLTLYKEVVNDNGGSAEVSDFPLFINGQLTTSGTVNFLTANVPYTASETNLFGYTAGVWTGDCTPDGSITLQPGQNATCTLVNNDQVATLIVVKHVVNDNGGDNVASDFTMNVDGTNVSDTSFPGNEQGTAVTLDGGSYNVSEQGPAGYQATYGEDCEGTIGVGETKTCTITNDDQAPTVTLIKSVTNDNGGTAGENDFGLTVGATGVDSGETLPIDANTPYALSEAGLVGYAFVSLTGDEGCPSQLGGTVELNEGEHLTCTITNDDQSAHLTVIKNVVNVGGSDAVASDFTLNVDAANADPATFLGDENGTLVTLDAGLYSVTENPAEGWTTTFSEGCSGTISNDGTATCTVTNTRDSGTINGTKFVDTNGNGTWDEGELVYAAGVTIHLSNGGTTTTGVDGTYSFENVPTGTYTVNEDVPSGWIATTPDSVSNVSVAKDQATTVDFGNFELGSISGYKFNDLNGNGTWDQGEPGLNGWEICLNGIENCQTTHLDGDDNPGFYEFTGLQADSYDVYEHQQDGWVPTTPKNGEYEGLEIQSGTNLTHQDFGNFRLGRIEGYKYDNQENGLSGWQICLDGPNAYHQCTTTDESGHYAFDDLLVGTYTVSETNQYGWTQVSPTDPGTHTVPVTSGTGTGEEHANYNFVNRQNAFDVSVEKTDSPDPVAAGAQLTYTLHWSISGNTPVSNVTVTDPLPTNTTFVSADNGGTESAGTVTWNLGTKNPGDSGDVHLTVNVATPLGNGTVLSNTGTVCGDGDLVGPFEGDPSATNKCDTDTTTTTVVSAPTLTLVKTDSPDPVAAGANLTYTLAWTVGGNATASNVVLTDVLPANTTFVSADLGGTYDGATNTVTWNLGSTTPPALGTVHLVVKVASPIVNGTVLTNTGKICGTNQPAPQQDIAPTVICGESTTTTTVASAPILTIAKVNDASTFVNPGATVTYTVTVSNTAAASDTAHSVQFTDALPAGFTFVIGGGSSKTFALGDLAPGAAVAASYQVTVSTSQTTGLYTNTATASATNHPAVVANSTVDVRVPQVLGIAALATLEVSKTADVAFAAPDTTVTYTVTVKNTGDATATNVVLHDVLPAGFTFVDGGGSTKDFRIGNLDPGTSRVINYRVRLSSHLKAGKYTNVVTAKADNTDKATAHLTLPVKVGKVLGLATSGSTPLDYAFLLAGLALMVLGALGLKKRSSPSR